MLDRIYYPFSCLKWGIKNLWTWLPVIWSDRPWDHAYLSRIIELKLYTMYRFLNSDKAVAIQRKKDLANLVRAALAARMLCKGGIYENEDDYLKSMLTAFEQSYLNWWD